MARGTKGSMMASKAMRLKLSGQLSMEVSERRQVGDAEEIMIGEGVFCSVSLCWVLLQHLLFGWRCGWVDKCIYDTLPTRDGFFFASTVLCYLYC
ncbi:hypothetical protein P280DRAFT_152880 [Massarina eburnea CBS 473.64]|uniref:Uncharacterized protein n=1 Tax=Massarina eburnea CBS 473.64 TaxID=1395130 RepID=A0A6A6RMB3_9PLEO|nr:hypothetical protein P280DRAFT_152880 [Massarina eburnea CBS 473.64]